MADLLSLLMRFSGGTDKWHAIPFSLKIKTEVWTVATDNCILFAIKLPGAAFRKDYPKALEGMILKEVRNPVEVNLKELKIWAGEVPSTIVPVEKVAPEHQGVFLNSLIDRRKIAYLFARFTTPVIRAWEIKPGVLGFEQLGKQWRVFLAGLDDKPDGTEPIFQVGKITQ
jgi:hypothetical protein